MSKPGKPHLVRGTGQSAKYTNYDASKPPKASAITSVLMEEIDGEFLVTVLNGQHVENVRAYSLSFDLRKQQVQFVIESADTRSTLIFKNNEVTIGEGHISLNK